MDGLECPKHVAACKDEQFDTGGLQGVLLFRAARQDNLRASRCQRLGRVRGTPTLAGTGARRAAQGLWPGFNNRRVDQRHLRTGELQLQQLHHPLQHYNNHLNNYNKKQHSSLAIY